MSNWSDVKPDGAAEKVGPHGVKVGDVFVETWGYDQTNIDYYEVVRLMPQSVELVHIPHKTVGEGEALRLTPDVGTRHEPRKFNYGVVDTNKRRGRMFVKRVFWSGDADDGGPAIRVSSFSNGYLWNGTSTHFDTIAAGYPGH